MAFTFLQQRRKQKYLIIILILIISAFLAVIWYNFFRKPVLPLSVEVPTPPKIEINWQVLRDPRLQELQLFEEIRPLEEVSPAEEIGRANPFIPY